MAASSTHWVARALWLVPAFLLLIAVHQTRTAYTLWQTIQHGQPAMAEVTAFHEENRVDVTYDYMNLRVRLPDGETIRREQMSVPHTIAPLLKNKKQLGVYVRRGAAQEVVVREGGIGRTQQRIATVNAAMSGLAALLFGVGVFWWNRYLRRRGDPSAERAGQREEEYSASQRMRK